MNGNKTHTHTLHSGGPKNVLNHVEGKNRPGMTKLYSELLF